MKSQLNIEQIRKATRQRAQQRPTYAAMLAFYESVFIAQEQAKSTIDLEPILLAPETLETSRQKDLPLVDIPAFRVDHKTAEDLLSQLCMLITTHGTAMAAAAKAVSGALTDQELQLHDLLERLLKSDDLFFQTTADQLHYFYAEEEKDLRVDVCDHCHKYLKTIDGREASRPVFPPLEQVASQHLDIIAAEKGFTGGIDLNCER